MRRLSLSFWPRFAFFRPWFQVERYSVGALEAEYSAGPLTLAVRRAAGSRDPGREGPSPVDGLLAGRGEGLEAGRKEAKASPAVPACAECGFPAGLSHGCLRRDCPYPERAEP